MATETLKEFFEPSMGISRVWSASFRISRGIPFTSSPRMRAKELDGAKSERLMEVGDCSRARVGIFWDFKVLIVCEMSGE